MLKLTIVFESVQGVTQNIWGYSKGTRQPGPKLTPSEFFLSPYLKSIVLMFLVLYFFCSMFPNNYGHVPKTTGIMEGFNTPMIHDYTLYENCSAFRVLASWAVFSSKAFSPSFRALTYFSAWCTQRILPTTHFHGHHQDRDNTIKETLKDKRRLRLYDLLH